MCPDVADKVDSGTTNSVEVRTGKSSNNRRACFRSTGFAEQSLFFRLAYPGVRQVRRSTARLSPKTRC